MRIIVAILMSLALTGAAHAGKHTITVHMPADATWLNAAYVKVKGAQPDTIDVRGHEDRSFTVEVNMPDGACQTLVSVIFARYQGRSQTYMNVCANGALSVSRR